MKVERYDPERHRQWLRAWLDWHDERPVAPELLPPTGFVVPELAMGFLYETDAKVALIEVLISNPLASREARGQALDVVVETIIEEARTRGFARLLGYTALPAVVSRAERHGFSVGAERYTLVTKVL
jgi:hypothetical protein